jgi:Ca-activated chloride channel family protein
LLDVCGERHKRGNFLNKSPTSAAVPKLQPGSAEVVVKAVAAAVAATLTVATISLSAQTGQTAPPQSGVFRSGSALVALNVTVQDRGAKYVAGLQPDDFVVYEDGVKQQVRFFEASAVPLDLIVLIDTSSSMADKMETVHDAASGFLKTLRDGDRGAVVGFADSVNVLQPLTSERALLERAIRGTAAKGSTSLNNAIYVSLKQFATTARADSDVRRQAIIVLSDGADTSSLVSFDDVLGLARKTGVNIYTVALQSRYPQLRADYNGRKYFSESDYSMKALARETGAQSFFPSPDELKQVYGAIATELASQYSIGYVPGNTRADGRFRRVIVQIISKPDLRLRTRPGYTAEGGVSVTTAQNVGGAAQR